MNKIIMRITKIINNDKIFDVLIDTMLSITKWLILALAILSLMGFIVISNSITMNTLFFNKTIVEAILYGMLSIVLFKKWWLEDKK